MTERVTNYGKGNSNYTVDIWGRGDGEEGTTANNCLVKRLNLEFLPRSIRYRCVRLRSEAAISSEQSVVVRERCIVNWICNMWYVTGNSFSLHHTPRPYRFLPSYHPYWWGSGQVYTAICVLSQSVLSCLWLVDGVYFERRTNDSPPSRELLRFFEIPLNHMNPSPSSSFFTITSTFSPASSINCTIQCDGLNSTLSIHCQLPSPVQGSMLRIN